MLHTANVQGLTAMTGSFAIWFERIVTVHLLSAARRSKEGRVEGGAVWPWSRARQTRVEADCEVHTGTKWFSAGLWSDLSLIFRTLDVYLVPPQYSPGITLVPPQYYPRPT